MLKKASQSKNSAEYDIIRNTIKAIEDVVESKKMEKGLCKCGAFFTVIDHIANVFRSSYSIRSKRIYLRDL